MKSILMEGTDKEISQNGFDFIYLWLFLNSAKAEIATYQKLEFSEGNQNFMRNDKGDSDFLLKFSNNSFRYQKQEKHKLDGSMEENIYQ